MLTALRKGFSGDVLSGPNLGREAGSRTASHAIYELVAVPAVRYQEYCVPFQVDRIVELLLCRFYCFFRDANGPENVNEVLLRQCGWPRRWLRAFPGRDLARAGNGH